jgi:hypothetical protein
LISDLAIIIAEMIRAFGKADRQGRPSYGDAKPRRSAP